MTTAEAAAANYRRMSVDLAAGTIPLDIAIDFSRKTVTYWARICKVAALVEEIDPDPLPVPCSLCGGLSKCDIAAHLLRTTYTNRSDR